MSMVAKAFKLGHAAAGLVPCRVAIAVGQAFGAVAWLVAPVKRRVAIRTMARVIGCDPNTPNAKCKTLAREMFIYYGRYWAEFIWLRPSRQKAVMDSLTIEGFENLRQARKQGKGVILLLPHMGNVEIFGPIAAQEQGRLVAVAERLGDAELTEWFYQHRTKLGVEILLADGTPNLMMNLLRALAANGAVALLCDRKVNGAGTLSEVELFGERTEIPSGFLLLAKHSRAPVLPCAARHTKGKGHAYQIGAPLELDLDDDEGSAQIVANHLEEFIRQAPSQWHVLTPNWPSDHSDA